MRYWRSKSRETRTALSGLRDAVPDLPRPCSASGCRGVERAPVRDARIVGADAGGHEIRELATALDLESVPSAEQGRFLLLVLEIVDDDVHD